MQTILILYFLALKSFHFAAKSEYTERAISATINPVSSFCKLIFIP